jgi:tetratricopeptide (TPR) repeat protein
VIGRSFSNFKIVNKIGSGGMGVVYKAEDTQSGDTVALKFLPPELTATESARKRFVREAQAVSALDHPNICGINDIVETPDGRLFICMPFYEGTTLRELIESGPLRIQETVEIAHEIAAGLSYAHERGIVHRDVKPDNVFMTKAGLVKLLDFGLAKLVGEARLTPTGERLGTLAYLSPEQARGDQVDARTDIWSLGVMMQQMLTGKLPFRGDSNQSLLYSILNEEPVPVSELRPDCPQHLADIVRRCLQKDPNARFQSLPEFIQQLKILSGSMRMDRALFTRPQKEVPTAGSASTLGRVFWPAAAVFMVLVITSVALWRGLSTKGTPPVGQTSLRVAVLPLANNAGEEPGDAFVIGLSETVASTAAELEPYHQSMWVLPYSQTAWNRPDIPGDARESFGVNRLLSGRVQRHGDKYRLTLDMLDAESLDPVESKHIDFTGESAHSLHTDVYDAVSDLLDVEAPAEQYPQAQPEGAASIYKSYLEGVGILRVSDEVAEVDDATRKLEQTVTEHPTFAEAHAWLAEAYQEKFRLSNDPAWLERAEASCNKALELDPTLTGAHVTLAEVYQATGRRAQALQTYADALAANPRHTYANLMMSDLLASQERVDEAEASYRKLIEVEPDYYEGHRALGRFYYARGRVDDAVIAFERALSLAPRDWRTMNKLGAIYHHQGRWDEASEMLERSLAIGGPLSVEDIRSDPLMGDLRADPRFLRLLDEHASEGNAGAAVDSTRR